jgi:hypothetical protein
VSPGFICAHSLKLIYIYISSLAGGGTASPTMIQQPTGPRARKSVEEEGDRCAMEYTGGMSMASISCNL